MANAHSAIDRLIALTTLKRYQGGGEVQPTMGQRFIQRFPSQHEDAMRAAEQERALAGLIDFIAPQSLGELGLMMAAGPVASKAAMGLKKSFKGLGKLKKLLNKGDEYRVTFSEDRPNLKGKWTGSGFQLEEGVGQMTTYLIPPHQIKKIDRVKTISLEEQARALGRFEEFGKYGSLDVGGKRIRPKRKYTTVYEKPE